MNVRISPWVQLSMKTLRIFFLSPPNTYSRESLLDVFLSLPIKISASVYLHWVGHQFDKRKQCLQNEWFFLCILSSQLIITHMHTFAYICHMYLRLVVFRNCKLPVYKYIMRVTSNRFTYSLYSIFKPMATKIESTRNKSQASDCFWHFKQ